MRCNIIFLFAILSMNVSAQITQNKGPNETSVHIGGGLSSIHHQPGFFNGYAVDFGIGYTYYIHPNWGIFFGLGQGIYNTRKKFNLDVLTPSLIDKNGYLFDLYTNLDYREAFQMMFLNIPVMIQYQTKQKNQSQSKKQNRYEGFYAMGGVKAAISIKDKYESKITTITNTAYYPDMNNWAATQKFAGLGTFNDESNSDGNLNLVSPSIRFALEAGVKWRLNNDFLLYIGAYCDLGLNHTFKNSRPSFRNYIAIDHLTDFTLLTFPEKIDMITAGIIVRLAFSRNTYKAYCATDKINANQKKNTSKKQR